MRSKLINMIITVFITSLFMQKLLKNYLKQPIVALTTVENWSEVLCLLK